MLGRHGIRHGYTDIIRVKYYVFWGKFLLRTHNVFSKIEFLIFYGLLVTHFFAQRLTLGISMAGIQMIQKLILIKL